MQPDQQNILKNAYSSTRQKNWIWLAKGVGIFLVVMGHFGPAYWWPITYDRVVAGIYLFHMPLFFFLSGYLYFVDVSTFSLTEFSKRFKKSVLRLGAPFLSVNILYILMKFGGQIFFHYDKPELSDCWKMFIFPYSNAPANLTWFLYVLFFFNILYAPILYMLRKKSLVLILAIVLYFIPGSTFLASDRLCRFFVYFCLGNYCCGILDRRFSSLKNNDSLILLIFFCIFLTITTFVSITTDETVLSMTKWSLVGSASGIAVVVIFALILSGRSVLGKFFTMLGRHSMVIYLFHQPFCWFFPVLLRRAGIEIFWGFLPGIFAGISFPIFIESYILVKYRLLSLSFLGGRTTRGQS